MRVRYSLWLGLGAWSMPVASFEHQSRQAIDPRRRMLQSLAVLNDYLYLEGGQISGGTYPFPMQTTQYISLAESWETETLSFGHITKSGEVENTRLPALWVDEQKSMLYRWGGSDPTGNLPDETVLYSLEPNGQGTGSWSTQPPSDPDAFDDIVGASAGAWGSCGNMGFAAGGYGSRATDPKLASSGDNVPVPGLLTYDFESRQWTNESTVEISPSSGTFHNAAGVCASDLGTSGLFFVLGGSSSSAAATGDNTPRSMTSISFFDAASKTWHWQEAKGEIPLTRDLFCAAGAQGPNSYEIFVYGGRHETEGILSDTYVLTIPGFEWFRVDLDSPPRHGHACTAVGGGQIVTSGGLASDGDGSWEGSDPWPYTLGVFSLGMLEWRSGYDASGGEYSPHEVIRGWYDDGGLDSVAWNSNETKGLFATDSDDTAPIAPTPAPTEPPPSGSSGSSGSDVPVGAIVGGVVGGVALVALIVALLFFRRRWRRKNAGFPAELPSDSSKPPPEYQQVTMVRTPAELEQYPRYDLPNAVTLAPYRRAELETESNRRAEVPGE